MSAQNSNKPWTYDQFKSDVINEDQDCVYNGLRDLLIHLEQVDSFPEIEKEGDRILTQLVDLILGDSSYLTNPTLRTIYDLLIKLIVPLISKMPQKLISPFYDLIFKYYSTRSVRHFTTLNRALLDSIYASSEFDEDRKKTVIGYLMPKLTTLINNSGSPELRNACLNLLEATIETLPYYLSPGMIQEVYKLIEVLSGQLCARVDTDSDEYLAMCESVANVSKVYTTVIKDDDKFNFFKYIESKLENNEISAYILSTIILYRPQYFNLDASKDEQNSFAHYLNLILDRISCPPILEEYDVNYVAFTVRYLSAVSILVSRYGNQLPKEMRDACINADFDFLNLGISTAEQADEAEGDNDAGFQVDGIDDEDDEEIQETAQYIPTDDSWKIRVAAMKLGICLIDEIGKEYYEVLTSITNECYTPNYVTNLICDHDVGSKMEAMNFFKVILHHFKAELVENKEILEDWLYSIISQINATEKDQVIYSFIDTISYSIQELHSLLTLELSLEAIKNITDVYKENTTDDTLVFMTYLLEYSHEAEIVSPLIKLITLLLQNASLHAKTKCLTMTSKIYYYYHHNCSKDTSLSKDLEGLNDKVIEYSKQKGEVKPYAITAISVFISCCPTLSTINKSADIIIGFLDDKSVIRASTTAISLISASESCQVLSRNINTIMEKLKNNLLLSDPVITNVSLWAVNLMLYKKILAPKDCQGIIDALFGILNNGENNSRVLCLIILNQIYPKGCDSKRLSSLADCLMGSSLSDEIIKEITELVLSSSKTSLDNVKPLIDHLINKSSTISDEKIVSNIALIVGISSATNKDYALSLVSSFKNHINDKGFSQVFALRCIGEIGSLINLSSQNDIVNSVFELIHANDRSIFVPASESFGLMSVGSPEILKKLANSAKTDAENFIIPWLFAINIFTKKVIAIKKHIPKEIFDQIVKTIPDISEFLLKCSKVDSKETSQTIAECLAGLVAISFNYSQTLINNASYVTIKAISIYFEEYSPYCNKHSLNEKEKQEIISLIQKIDEKYDNENPMLDYSIMQCLKFAITKNLAQELFDLNIKDRFIDGTKILGSHSSVSTVGTMVRSEDIGKYLRYTTFTCLELLIKSNVANQLDYDEIGTDVFNAILDEKDEHSIMKKALDIIPILVKSTIPEAQEAALSFNEDGTIVDALKNFETVCQNFPSEVMDSFYNALLSLQSLPSLASDESRKIKNIISRRQNDPILVKILKDYDFNVKGASTDYLFTNGYISSKLMEELYPAASSIFVNN